jgi:HK97 gp10 family phage protein
MARVRARVIITGDREIRRKLKDLGAKQAGAIVRKALRAQAKARIKPAIEQNAPVAETRALKRSVIVRAAKRSRKWIGVVVGYDESKFKDEKFHAAFVEYGTNKQPAQGTMRRSYDQQKGPTARALVAEIKAGIDRAAGS